MESVEPPTCGYGTDSVAHCLPGWNSITSAGIVSVSESIISKLYLIESTFCAVSPLLLCKRGEPNAFVGIRSLATILPFGATGGVVNARLVSGQPLAFDEPDNRPAA
jgi:hypothetical protein